MNSVDTHVVIEGMAASIRAGSQSGSHLRKLPVKDATTKSSPNTQLYLLQTEASYSTYGPHDERIAIVVKNKKTGETLREIPSKQMQNLYVPLDMLM